MTIVNVQASLIQNSLKRELPKPCNGPCDRADECHYAKPVCKQGLDPRDFHFFGNLHDIDIIKPAWWTLTNLPAAPNRRWMNCAGWPLTLGMVFDIRSGCYVYPQKHTLEIRPTCEKCYSSMIRSEDKDSWFWKCPKCGHEFGRYPKPSMGVNT